MIAIYALLHDEGGARYIGRTAQDPATRLSWHWRRAGHERDYYHPKNMWLRARYAKGLGPPQLKILDMVKDRGRNEDLPYIRAYRAEFPGELTNLYPCLKDDAPEWALFEFLQRHDPADFSYEEFRAKIAISTSAGRAAVMRRVNAENKERFDKIRQANVDKLKNDVEYKSYCQDRQERIWRERGGLWTPTGMKRGHYGWTR